MLLKSLNLRDLICCNAERKTYGIKAKDAILYEDESPTALWCWEISNTLLLPAHLQKSLPNVRLQKASTSQKIKSLDKMLSIIEKARTEKDIPRIVEEYEKYNKVLRKENAVIQKEL